MSDQRIVRISRRTRSKVLPLGAVPSRAHIAWALEVADRLVAFRRRSFIVSQEEIAVPDILRALAGEAPEVSRHEGGVLAILEAEERLGALVFVGAIALWGIAGEHDGDTNQGPVCGDEGVLGYRHIVCDSTTGLPAVRAEGLTLHELAAALAVGIPLPVLAERLSARAAALAEGLNYLAHVIDAAAVSYARNLADPRRRPLARPEDRTRKA